MAHNQADSKNCPLRLIFTSYYQWKRIEGGYAFVKNQRGTYVIYSKIYV